MNLAIYVLIYGYIHDAINDFMSHLMNQMMVFVSGIALLLVTIWILLIGYRVITGQLREPLMGVVTNMARIVVIVSVATSLSIGGSSLHDMFTDTLPTDLNKMFTGSSDSIPESINANLKWTVASMAAIEAVQAPPNDVNTTAEKARAADLAIFGTACPPLAIGAMLLMYQFAIALFVGLGPLFILCLIFEQTKGLFHKWLLYGIGTLFSMALLSFISAIVLQVTLRAASALWATNFINGLMKTSSEGLSTQSLEQGGIGLLMTMLVISVPPMAGNFFQGTLGQFYSNSTFGRGTTLGIGADGRPGTPGSFIPSSSPPATATASQGNFQGGNAGFSNPSATTRLTTGQATIASADVIKPAPSSAGD